MINSTSLSCESTAFIDLSQSWYAKSQDGSLEYSELLYFEAIYSHSEMHSIANWLQEFIVNHLHLEIFAA